MTIGTRPEAIKLMPVIRALENRGAGPMVFLTGQHQELLDPTLEALGISATEDLNLMQPSQSLASLSARVLTGMQELLQRHRPRMLVVQGDTTTVSMAALAAFYEDVPVAHVEAGLRTGVARNPFPEELNRKLVACIAGLHFAPTPRARENLLRENVPAEKIHLVGNTAIDALFLCRDRVISRAPGAAVAELLRLDRSLVLVTAHRRESFGEDMVAIIRGVARLATALHDSIRVVFPVHLNPSVQSVARELLGGIPNVRLLEPLSYLDFVAVLLRARLIITDSGGLQEEAAALGVPVLVVRRTTERPEAIEAGVAELVGPDEDRIFEAGRLLLCDPTAHSHRAIPTDVFGDGQAAERIAQVICATG